MTTRTTDTVCGLATSAGNRRDRNEDAALTGPEWYVVADGMGGHDRGDLASRIVVDAFAATALDPAAVARSITTAVAVANAAVRATARDIGALGMGSTLVGLAVGAQPGRARSVAVFHAGDSRCYRLADGELRLITHDHTYVQELIEGGRLTSEQAIRHPLRNVVTRAIGVEDDVTADIAHIEAGPSRYLLCSDGLTAELGPRVLGRVMSGILDPQAAADRLVELALEGAADDNVTALIVDIGAVRKNDGTPTPAATP